MITQLETVSVEQLIMLSGLFKRVDGRNRSVSEIRVPFSLFCDTDHVAVAQSLKEARLVYQQGSDYFITGRGKSIVEKSCRLDLEMLVSSLADTPLFYKLKNLVHKYDSDAMGNRSDSTTYEAQEPAPTSEPEEDSSRGIIQFRSPETNLSSGESLKEAA